MCIMELMLPKTVVCNENGYANDDKEHSSFRKNDSIFLVRKTVKERRLWRLKAKGRAP